MTDEIKCVSESKKKSQVILKGFYITPFKEKEITIEGSGVVSSINKKVNFDEVIKTVSEFLNSSSCVVGEIEYKFQLKIHEIRSKFLDESIMRNIDQADFIVVDWTSANHNVLNEAGYARGRGKHGIHICSDHSLPTDKAGIIYINYELENLKGLTKSISEHLPELIQRVESGTKVYDYYDSRSPVLIDHMICDSNIEICLLQTNLETINANHLSSLIDALKRNVKLRILTLDPQSRYVNERALQLGYTNKTIKVYRNGLQNAIENTEARLSSFKNWQIRLYNDFPTQLTYIFDDRILVSIMSRTGRSRNNCTFILPTSRLTGPKHTFIDHFEDLWKQEEQQIPE